MYEGTPFLQLGIMLPDGLPELSVVAWHTPQVTAWVWGSDFVPLQPLSDQCVKTKPLVGAAIAGGLPAHAAALVQHQYW